MEDTKSKGKSLEVSILPDIFDSDCHAKSTCSARNQMARFKVSLANDGGESFWEGYAKCASKFACVEMCPCLLSQHHGIFSCKTKPRSRRNPKISHLTSIRYGSLFSQPWLRLARSKCLGIGSANVDAFDPGECGDAFRRSLPK